MLSVSQPEIRDLLHGVHPELLHVLAFVEKELQDAEKGHDLEHIVRVLQNIHALSIGKSWLPIHLQVAYAVGLLHDIRDKKFSDKQEDIPEIIEQYCFWLPESRKKEVEDSIAFLSFDKGKNHRMYHSKPFALVHDADKLDALGAIGIARAFHYGGFRNRPLYDKASIDGKESTSSLGHFYEKLFLLPERMLTPEGKREAKRRVAFMQTWVDELHLEVLVGREQTP